MVWEGAAEGPWESWHFSVLSEVRILNAVSWPADSRDDRSARHLAAGCWEHVSPAWKQIFCGVVSSTYAYFFLYTLLRQNVASLWVNYPVMVSAGIVLALHFQDRSLTFLLLFSFFFFANGGSPAPNVFERTATVRKMPRHINVVIGRK